MSMASGFEPLERVKRDLRQTARGLTVDEARFLVDLYYQSQDYRIRASGQVRASEDTEPHELVAWCFGAFERVEDEVRKMLGIFADSRPAGAWALSQHGIGPVLAAGLVAHIDITKAPTVGHIWRFAGLDPTVKWERSQKRPWNAKLKVLCWKIGDSFVKQSGSEKCRYGKLYRERKEYELARNESGGNAAQAAVSLTEKKWKESDTRSCYEAGKLPPGRIDLRARRWAVKLFLAHYHDAAFRAEYNEAPPKPYPIAILGHAHEIVRQ